MVHNWRWIGSWKLQGIECIVQWGRQEYVQTDQKCTVAKDAWEILKNGHEGTSKVKISRLQLLTTKFENLKMMEDKNIHDYYLNILDIANSFDSFGEKIYDEKLVRKILRSLPKRFDIKVTAIEEAHDISRMKVDELIGSHQNF